MARILLVEDFPDIRTQLAVWLTSLGHAVVGEVGRGDEVLAAVLETEPDVVLLNISLPGRSGLDLLPELCAAAPTIVTIMLSVSFRKVVASAFRRASPWNRRVHALG